MKKIKAVMLVILFIAVFTVSALVTVALTGSAPNRLLRVDWNEEVGTEYLNLEYENDYGHKYDLYIPSGMDKTQQQNLILFIHGGSFNSGSKEDGTDWCKYYTAKGYLTASMDYSLQTVVEGATLNRMNSEVLSCVYAIKDQCEKYGISIGGMATCGVSAGGTLALNFAYSCAETSPIPVKFVFQLVAPADFEPSDWGILKKVNGIKTDSEFVESMTGMKFTEEEIAQGKHEEAVTAVSPARLVNEKSVPTLCGYGLRDHVVPQNQRELLVKALKDNKVTYDYLEFPHSNHGMYADLDILQEFLELSLDYCNKYFE